MREPIVWRLAADCPVCGYELVLRRNRRNREVFIACGAYPNCTFTEPYVSVVQTLAQILARKQAPAVAALSQAIDRELRKVIALAHPDRWNNSQIAHDVTAALIDIRSGLRRGELS